MVTTKNNMKIIWKDFKKRFNVATTTTEAQKIFFDLFVMYGVRIIDNYWV